MYARSGREYFLIENRRKAGRDAALPDEGLAIWHLDEDGDNSNEQMTVDSHYECSLEQADGLFQLERQRGQVGDAADLFTGAATRFADNTLPDSKWWNGTPSNLSLDQISAAGANVSFRSLLGEVIVPPQTLRRESQPNRPIPDNNNTGIADAIVVTEAQTILSIKVGVDITHPFRGDLRVTLTTPWGVVIELHPKNQGGSADDLQVTYDETSRPALATLRGRSTQGPGSSRRRIWRRRTSPPEPLVAGVRLGYRRFNSGAVAGVPRRHDPRQYERRHRTHTIDGGKRPSGKRRDRTGHFAHLYRRPARAAALALRHRGGAA